MPPAPFISVIIPTLNEAAVLEATLRCVACPHIDHEIIVVDAGSSDGTQSMATRAGCEVVLSPQRQRAAQMNHGAARARGEVFLFLHADTLLGSGALAAIREALRDPRVVGGAFRRRYDSPSRWLTLTCQLAAWRNWLIGWHLGDQAMFVRARVFEDCGRFAEVARFEDLDLSRRLKGCGRVVTLQPPVISDARRFAQDGAVLRTAKDIFLTGRYLVRGLTPPGSPPSARKPLAPSTPALKRPLPAPR